MCTLTAWKFTGWSKFFNWSFRTCWIIQLEDTIVKKTKYVLGEKLRKVIIWFGSPCIISAIYFVAVLMIFYEFFHSTIVIFLLNKLWTYFLNLFYYLCFLMPFSAWICMYIGSVHCTVYMHCIHTTIDIY